MKQAVDTNNRSRVHFGRGTANGRLWSKAPSRSVARRGMAPQPEALASVRRPTTSRTMRPRSAGGRVRVCRRGPTSVSATRHPAERNEWERRRYAAQRALQSNPPPTSWRDPWQPRVASWVQVWGRVWDRVAVRQVRALRPPSHHRRACRAHRASPEPHWPRSHNRRRSTSPLCLQCRPRRWRPRAQLAPRRPPHPRVRSSRNPPGRDRRPGSAWRGRW